MDMQKNESIHISAPDARSKCLGENLLYILNFFCSLIGFPVLRFLYYNKNVFIKKDKNTPSKKNGPNGMYFA